MANIITFKRQPEEDVWKYTYWIFVGNRYSGYIGKCNKNSKPFVFSTTYCLDFEADSFNELKKLVRQKIKEKLNG